MDNNNSHWSYIHSWKTWAWATPASLMKLLMISPGDPPRMIPAERPLAQQKCKPLWTIMNHCHYYYYSYYCYYYYNYYLTTIKTSLFMNDHCLPWKPCCSGKRLVWRTTIRECFLNLRGLRRWRVTGAGPGRRRVLHSCGGKRIAQCGGGVSPKPCAATCGNNKRRLSHGESQENDHLQMRGLTHSQHVNLYLQRTESMRKIYSEWWMFVESH